MSLDTTVEPVTKGTNEPISDLGRGYSPWIQSMKALSKKNKASRNRSTRGQKKEDDKRTMKELNGRK